MRECPSTSLSIRYYKSEARRKGQHANTNAHVDADANASLFVLITLHRPSRPLRNYHHQSNKQTNKTRTTSAFRCGERGRATHSDTWSVWVLAGGSLAVHGWVAQRMRERGLWSQARRSRRARATRAPGVAVYACGVTISDERQEQYGNKISWWGVPSSDRCFGMAK